MVFLLKDLWLRWPSLLFWTRLSLPQVFHNIILVLLKCIILCGDHCWMLSNFFKNASNGTMKNGFWNLTIWLLWLVAGFLNSFTISERQFMIQCYFSFSFVFSCCWKTWWNWVLEAFGFYGYISSLRILKSFYCKCHKQLGLDGFHQSCIATGKFAIFFPSVNLYCPL